MTMFEFVGVKNFISMAKDEYFWKSLRVTAFYTFGAVPLRMTIALLLSLLLNQPVPGRGVWRTLYYLPAVTSGVAVAVLWTWIFEPQYGLLNSFLAYLGIEGPRWIHSEAWALPSLILMSLWGVGGGMLIYLAGLQSIPTHLYEAAEIDGANALQRFSNVTLPMLSPTIFFNLIMGIIGSFQVFTASFIMTQGGPNNATLTLVLYLYRSGFEYFKFGYASALAWVLFLVIMIFTLMIIKSSAIWVYYEGELRR
jgi:multiple sugar transport system permease protein